MYYPILEYPDVFGVGTNRNGVDYLYNVYDSQTVVAKVCTSCNEWKFLSGFNKAGKGYAGTHSLCRDCHKESNKQYREGVRNSVKKDIVTPKKKSFKTREQELLKDIKDAVETTESTGLSIVESLFYSLYTRKKLD